MNRHRAESMLRLVLQPILTSFGFKEHDKLCYSREMPAFSHVLTFPMRIKHNVAYFHCVAGIRYAELGRWLDKSLASHCVPHVLTPVHLLRPKPHYSEWAFVDEQSLVQHVSEVNETIKFASSVFLTPMSSVSVLISRLSSSSPTDWFALDPMQRARVLASALYQGGRRSESLQVVRDALLEHPTFPIHWKNELKLLEEQFSKTR